MKKLFLISVLILLTYVHVSAQVVFFKCDVTYYNFKEEGSVETISVHETEVKNVGINYYKPKTAYGKNYPENFRFVLKHLIFDLDLLKEQQNTPMSEMNGDRELYWREGYAGAYYLESDGAAKLTIEKIGDMYIEGHLSDLKLYPYDFYVKKEDKKTRNSSYMLIKNCKFKVLKEFANSY